jgi:hypothetical protein
VVEKARHAQALLLACAGGQGKNLGSEHAGATPGNTSPAQHHLH